VGVGVRELGSVGVGGVLKMVDKTNKMLMELNARFGD
jgi:hypothetical protein